MEKLVWREGCSRRLTLAPSGGWTSGEGTRTEQEGGNGGQRHGEGAESTLLSSVNGAASGEGRKHAGSEVSTGHPA